MPNWRASASSGRRSPGFRRPSRIASRRVAYTPSAAAAPSAFARQRSRALARSRLTALTRLPQPRTRLISSPEQAPCGRLHAQYTLYTLNAGSATAVPPERACRVEKGASEMPDPAEVTAAEVLVDTLVSEGGRRCLRHPGRTQPGDLQRAGRPRAGQAGDAAARGRRRADGERLRARHRAARRGPGGVRTRGDEHGHWAGDGVRRQHSAAADRGPDPTQVDGARARRAARH